MILPPPPGFSDKDILAGSSKTRNSTALASSGSTSECSIPHQSNLPQGSLFSALDAQGSLFSALDAQGNSYGMCMNLPKSVEPANFSHRFDNQLLPQNNLSETQPASSGNSHGTAIEKDGNSSYNMLSQQPSPSIKTMRVVETRMMSNSPTDNVLHQTEGHRSIASVKSSGTDTGKLPVGPNLQELMNFVSTTHGLNLKMPPEMGSSEYLKLVQLLQQNSVQPNGCLDGLNRGAFSQADYTVGLKESGVYSKVGAVSNPPNVEVASLGPSVHTQQDENTRPTQNGQFGRAPTHFNNISHSKVGSHGEGNIKVKEMTISPSTEKPKLALAGNESSGHRDNQEKIVDNGHNNDSSHGAPKIGEKIKLLSEKVAHVAAGKLWDGSLQLSSSVTLSAVAFFKSGEKLLGKHWPEFVEVKGKVRLEAFEKYIQDLPRSRNRGLMVISLCWKEGSSESGLTGMKEVAKGYIKSSRVGFAQLLSSTDLYICPRSDPIITILAKYGFFKGMAVVDDKQDSMIGCVVWRKNNRPPSNPVGNKLERKGSPSSVQPKNSPSSLSIKQDTEKKFSPIRLAQESNLHIQPEIRPTSATLENAREMSTENQNIVSGGVDTKASNTSTNCSSLSNPDGSQSSKLVRKRPSFEDDDLPEYDFGIACGNSTPAGQPQNPTISNNHGLASVNCQTLDHPRLAQHPSIVSRDISPCSESQAPFYPVSDEKKTHCKDIGSRSFEQSSKKTKLFDDDDDDMPEWCPPELQNPIPPQGTNSSLHNLASPLPPRPRPVPPPPPADTRSAFSYQPFRPPISCPTSIPMRPPPPTPTPPPPPPPLPVHQDSGSSYGLNSNQALRYPPSLPNANPPFPFSNGRRPRP